jgi:hypothetical protein
MIMTKTNSIVAIYKWFWPEQARVFRETFLRLSRAPREIY